MYSLCSIEYQFLRKSRWVHSDSGHLQREDDSEFLKFLLQHKECVEHRHVDMLVEIYRKPVLEMLDPVYVWSIVNCKNIGVCLVHIGVNVMTQVVLIIPKEGGQSVNTVTHQREHPPHLRFVSNGKVVSIMANCKCSH